MDPLALNYDAQATTNNGSCVYAITEYTPAQVTLLPDILHEASGIEWLPSGLYIHNDAGNPDRLYRIDSLSGEILQTITIAGADNLDWEDITEDEDYIYLGDIGNNIGNRTDLRIYKIQKSELVNNVVNAEIIDFYYEDQVDFEPGMNDHNYDCEALIAYGDNLHLFTKNWEDKKTRHYVLPKTAGNHAANLVEELDVEGLITAADISAEGALVMIGYTEFGLNFMWLFFDYTDSQFFSGNKRKIALGAGFNNGQTEGLTLRNNSYGYICSEAFSVNQSLVLPQKMLSFSVGQWLDPPLTNVQDLTLFRGAKAFPNPFKSFVKIELEKPIDRWRLLDTLGKTIHQGRGDEVVEYKFNTGSWSPGVYFFEVYSGGKLESIRLVKEE